MSSSGKQRARNQTTRPGRRQVRGDGAAVRGPSNQELWRERVAALQDELKQAELEKARLQEDMLSLLSFLEQLSSILSGERAEPPRGK